MLQSRVDTVLILCISICLNLCLFPGLNKNPKLKSQICSQIFYPILYLKRKYNHLETQTVNYINSLKTLHKLASHRQTDCACVCVFANISLGSFLGYTSHQYIFIAWIAFQGSLKVKSSRC